MAYAYNGMDGGNLDQSLALSNETSWVWWMYPSLKTRMKIHRVHNL
jgi:hypothetical protein